MSSFSPKKQAADTEQRIMGLLTIIDGFSQVRVKLLQTSWIEIDTKQGLTEVTCALKGKMESDYLGFDRGQRPYRNIK